jgi:hypothetical protein
MGGPETPDSPSKPVEAAASGPERVFYAGRMRTLEAIERRRDKNREWSYRMYWDDDAYRRRKLVMDSIRGAEKTIAKYTELLEQFEREHPERAGRDNLFALDEHDSPLFATTEGAS